VITVAVPEVLRKDSSRRCATCGAGRAAFPRYLAREHPFLRSPESIARQAQQLARLTRAPIFLVGDLLDGGEEYARATIDALARANVKNVLTLEFFAPPPAWFIEYVPCRLHAFGVEISPESHDPTVRALFGKAEYPNEDLEESIEYVGRLFKRFDPRLTAFVSPWVHFSIPGVPRSRIPKHTGIGCSHARSPTIVRCGKIGIGNTSSPTRRAG